MRAAIYTRVSTDEQAKEGLSLDVQERDCKEAAKKQGYTVVGVYSDPGFSGALEKRPDLDRLFAAASAGRFDVLLTWKFDRLYRVVEYQKRARRELTERGIIWKSATEDIDIYTSSGNLQHSIHATFSEWERDVIKERTIAGRRQKARKGKQPMVVGRPYGYRIIRRDEGIRDPLYVGRDGEYEIVPEEAEVVKLIYRMALDGSSLWEISKLLGDRNIPTAKGGLWRPNTVRGILTNTVYTGTAHHGRFIQTRTKDPETGRYRMVHTERPKDEWIPISSPALVTVEEFERVQVILRDNKVKKSGRPDRVYPLSGMLRCQGCGKPYNGKTFTDGRNRYYRPFRPTTPVDVRCGNTDYLVAGDVEAGILKLLSLLARNPEVIHDALQTYWEDEQGKSNRGERQRLETELGKVEKQLRGIIEREIEEPDMAGIYADMKAEKKAARQSLMERLSQLPEEPETPDAPQIKTIEAVCDELARRLVEINDPKTMREVFLALIDRVEVEPDGNLLVRFSMNKLSISS